MDAAYFSHILLVLAVVLIAAKLGGHIARRFGQPNVLGELAAGVILGNLALAGYHGFERWKTDPTLDVFSQLGVILLVFQVGVQSTVPEMLGVGVPALLVGSFGVIGSFVLTWAIAAWMIPSAGLYTHMFLAATLSATSVSISTRVLKDLGRTKTPEARVILGAAVVDDVVGLVMLALVTGIIGSANGGTAVGATSIAWIVIRAAAFLVGALALGVAFSPRVFRFAARLDASGALLATGLAFCFLLAWLADEIGLAPIIGAFAAGLVLEDAYSREFVARGERSLDDLLEVFTSFLGPIFFVMVGARTDVSVFVRIEVIGLAAALSAAAILGKQFCVLGTLGRSLDRVSIGIGMIPRGEVQLIFASLGLTLAVGGRRVIDQQVFSAIIIVVIVTTLLTPPGLKWSFKRSSRRASKNQPLPRDSARSFPLS